MACALNIYIESKYVFVILQKVLDP